jgi:hypothetical protein
MELLLERRYRAFWHPNRGPSAYGVKPWFKNELKNKDSGVKPEEDPKIDTSCISIESQIEKGHIQGLDNLQLVAAGENRCRAMTEPDSDKTDYPEDEGPRPVASTPACIDRCQPPQLQKTAEASAPNRLKVTRHT